MMKVMAVAVAVLGAVTTAAHAQEGKNIGDSQQCISLGTIDQTIVIDNKTILVKTKPHGYKRMDLVNTCSGLKIQGGFGYSTSTSQLCKQDVLTVIEQNGSTCMIDKIITIDDAEAKALMSER